MAHARPSSSLDPLDRLVGDSPALQTVRAQIRHLARFDAVGQAVVPTVLLQGETGTGKGLVACVIHESGPRAPGPFIEVNCAAIPETLLEAELFGVEAGAFTDAKRAKPGLFEAAARGTLFLDEIEALPLTLQAKLLTALEAKRVRRLGAVGEHAVDVKLIAATPVALGALVQAGRFRADLYHRLAVVVLELPPLRAREDDVLLLARACLQHYSTIYGVRLPRLSQAAEAWLRAQPWPGNVREVRHLLERVVLLEAATVIDPESLARQCLPHPAEAVAVDVQPMPTLDVPADERTRLTDALQLSVGNLAAAARLLGISRGGLRYRLRKYGLERPLPQDATSVTSTEAATPPALPSPAMAIAPSGPRLWPQDTAPEAARRVGGWVPKPVAVLAIDTTWPELTEAAPHAVDPWTLAHCWQQRLAEKLTGFGGVLLQASPAFSLVAFGLAQTLEQLPQRAVQAALAIRQLATELQAVAGQACGPVVRLAGHLGTLLVADGAETSPPPWLAVGETLSLPVRLLGQAAPGEVLVSAPIARLTHDRIDLQVCQLPPGEATWSAAVAYHVQGLLPAQGPPTRGESARRRPFVGRGPELEALQALRAQVTSGRGQVVGLVGEPGIGKSRLLAEWRHSLAAHEVTYLEGHCWASGPATPYLPVLDLLRAQCAITPADSPEGMHAKVRRALQALDLAADEWAPALLHILGSAPGTDALVGLSPEGWRAKTFAAWQQLCLRASQRQPLVLAVEDGQWIDPTSEACLAQLVDRLAGAAILLLVTYRPGYRPPWLEKSYATQLSLGPLTPEASLQIVRAVLPTEIVAADVTEALLARAQGNPFFLEELAQAAVERRALGHEGGLTRPPTLPLPTTVQAVLAARIDRLPAQARALLQTLAVIGPRGACRLLQQVMAQPEEVVSQGVGALQAAELVYEVPAAPEPTVTFKHVLTQEVAYASLPQVRTHALHERTAQAIEALAGERLAEHYGVLAHHYSRSGNAEQAVVYLQRAGQQAADRSAYGEAITYLTRDLALLPHLPDTPERSRHELEVQITLGQAYIATKGQASSEMEHAFTRAQALCEQLRETAQLSEVLRGLRVMYVARGPLSKARELAEQLLSLAKGGQDAVRLSEAHEALGDVLFWLGEFSSARAHLEQGRVIADAVQGSPAALHDRNHTGVRCRRYGAWTLWYLGYPDQALQLSHEALGLAQERGSLYIVAWALFYAGILHCLRREAPAAQERAEATMALARQHEFRGLLARGTRLRGWALAAQGQHVDGFAQMHQGLTAFGVAGEAGLQPLFRALLAEMYARVGRATAGLSTLDGALAYIHTNGSRWYEAELHRLTGELLLREEVDGEVSGSPPPELPMIHGPEGEGTAPSLRPIEAETWFRQALDIARRQQAKSLELRAATSLSRLWQQQGRRAKAYELLAPIYDWFTEGFDTADLQDARALIEALACPR